MLDGGVLDVMENTLAGIRGKTAAKSNYEGANLFVKKVEQAVNQTKATVKENKSNNLFNVSSELLQKNAALNKKYEVSGDAVTKSILEDWTAIVELRKNVRTDSVAIDNEAKKIEERFRQLAGL